MTSSRLQSDGPVLEVTDLVKHFSTASGFRSGSGTVKAVDGV